MNHTLEPFFSANSTILILGSFPSVASRETGFYYGHKQNRFWKVLAQVLGESVPRTTEQKKSFLLRNDIALWDVIASCSIQGSADSTITDVVANDLSVILNNSNVKSIFVNGKKAYQLYQKHLASTFGNAVYLPSTSPANAAFSLERLHQEWLKILQ